MELKRYLKILQSWWWLVVVSFLVVTVAGFAFSFTRQPMYRSTMTLIVSPRKSITEVSALRQTLESLDQTSILNTYAEVMRSQNIYAQSIASLGLPAGASQTPAEVSVSVIQNTNLIKINAEGASPQLVYQITNAIAENSIRYVNDLFELYEIKVLDPAVVPTTPFSPEVPRDTLLSAVLGLILGVTLAFFAEYLKKPLESIEQMSILDRETGLYNRRYFLQRVRQEASRTKRNLRPMAVCLIELVGLDGVEGSYPKQIVQAVQRRAFAHLKRYIRQDEILARWDGERLAWLLLDTNETATRKGIERLSGMLETKVFEDDETGAAFTFSANFGAIVSNGEMPEKELMALCEQTLRQASPTGAASIQIAQAANSSLMVAKPGTAEKPA